MEEKYIIFNLYREAVYIGMGQHSRVTAQPKVLWSVNVTKAYYFDSKEAAKDHIRLIMEYGEPLIAQPVYVRTN